MIAKWYFGALILIFTFFGVQQEQLLVPNQEIVLQFSYHEVSSNVAQQTIASVKKQLQNLGVDNIQVKEAKGGTLKITYYSAIDVVSVKNKLSKAGKVIADYTLKGQEEFPSEEKTIHYNIDVYKIQDNDNTQTGFSGNCVLEQKIESDRFFNPNLYKVFYKTEDRENQSKVTVAYKIRRHIALAIDNTSRSIPEVRAGPSNNKTS